ncbi:MAG: amidohydrolase family protein [Myxococcota bacterium]|nr:amidohydrolase family protein [Myxococcota bacterium]
MSSLTLGGASLWLGCDSGIEVSDAEREALDAHLRDDPLRSGQGRLGPLRFRGYRGLAELPWFELRDGLLHMVDESVPAGIDVHTHLGMAYLFAPSHELNARTERVVYHLDCDATEPGCELDLDVYMNGNFQPHELTSLRWDTLQTLTVGSADAATATLPNLAAELDRMRMAQAAVLPIALNLPFRGDPTDDWLDAIDRSADPGRFVRGASLLPGEPDPGPRLEALHARGVRILKLHPEVQRFRPDAPEMMPTYEACERLGIVVIFHAGRSGIEPESVRPYALPRHFEAVLAEFPELIVVLGHGGARDLVEMRRVADPHRNALFGIASLGASSILTLLEELGPERVVFGSDWPFYTVSSALAKLLLATRHDPGLREPVLRGNLTGRFGA